MFGRKSGASFAETGASPIKPVSGACNIDTTGKVNYFYTRPEPKRHGIARYPNPKANVQTTVENAAVIVRAGGVVACPTEAVFGLSCDPGNEQAVMRIISLKNRTLSKGLILIAADFSQLEEFCIAGEDVRWEAIRASWPGPHTWLFRASSACPAYLRGVHSTIAMRVTAHAIASQLCELSGSALVSTSANLSGQPSARDASAVASIFGGRIDAIVTGETGGSKTPTTITNAMTGEWVR